MISTQFSLHFCLKGCLALKRLFYLLAVLLLLPVCAALAQETAAPFDVLAYGSQGEAVSQLQ